jgi:hypothetical protein
MNIGADMFIVKIIDCRVKGVFFAWYQYSLALSID